MWDDRSIWKRFKRGNEKALSDIYMNNVDFLLHYGLKFTHSKELVFDAIHDLFLTLIRTKQNIGETDNIRLYLIKALRRQILSEKNKRLKELRLSDTLQISSPIDFSIEEQIMEGEQRSERKEKLQKALLSLNSKQQEILYYKFTCGFDYDEICEVMNIKYDTARQLVSRAIQTIKKTI